MIRPFQTLRSVVQLLAILAAAAVSQAPARAGEKYALVVGVEKYIPTELPSLTYAEDDAEALGRALASLGFSVITMTGDADNPRHRPTTAARIVEQVEVRLDDRAPDDTVVLAFSGHGLQFKGDREFYFCPGEAELDDRSSLVPMGRVMAEIGRCKAGRKLVLVDACRNELTPEAAAKSGIAIELEPAVAFRAQPPQGTIALFSCQPKEKSYELERLGHSVFTHHVLEYLGGRADAARYPRREVTVEELVPFVRAQTRETASKILGATQRPEALVPETRIPDWPLGTLGDEAGADRGQPAARPRPFRHDAAESRRRVTAARRILATDLANLRAELEKTPVPAQGEDPLERERRMFAWALASLGDREGTLRHVWMPAPPTEADDFFRIELAEASIRTLGLLKRRRPDADVSQAVRRVFEAGGRYLEESARDRLRWAFLDADSFLPAIDPAEQERHLALAIDGIGDYHEACLDIVMRNPRHFATAFPRERMAAFADQYPRTHTVSSAADDDDAPYFAATAIVLAAFADDFQAVERMRGSCEEVSSSVQQAVVPFALRGDLDHVERLLARPEKGDARLPIAINALLDGGHVALARRLFERVDAPQRLDEGYSCFAENGARDMPDILRVGGFCGPFRVATRTLGRLGEEDPCREMLDRTRQAGGDEAATVSLRWLEFLDGLLSDCDLPP